MNLSIGNGKIVMCGCHEAGYELIANLLEQGVRIDYFVTITESMALKENVSGFRSFEDLAKEYGIPIYFVRSYSMKHEDDVRFFEEHRFDLLIQGGWQRLFPELIIKTLTIGAIGVHGSPDFLPKGRGRSPINWSLINDAKRFIIHFFIIKPGVDDGDIFHYEIFDINLWDDCNTLYLKNAYVSSRALLKYIPLLLQRKVEFKSQSGEPTYYLKRNPEDGRIDFSKSVFELHNFIRALTKPYPGAFCFYQNSKILIWIAQPFDTRLDTIEMLNGEVVESFTNGWFVIKTEGGLLLVKEYSSDIVIKKGMILK